MYSRDASLVLFPDAATSYAFYVTSSSMASQYTISSSEEILLWDSIVTITGGGFDTTTGKYTIQTSGYYVLTFNVVVNSGTLLIAIKDNNGVELAGQMGKSLSASIEAITGTVVVALDQGQFVYLHVQKMGTASIWFGKSWFAGWFQKAKPDPTR